MAQRRNISGIDVEGIGGVDHYWCTADQLNATTALANSTFLSASLVAGATYFYRAFIIYSATSTAKFVWAHSFPSGATLSYGDATNFFGSGTASDTWSGQGVSTKLSFGLDGYVKVGATAGNLVGRFAQSVADASNADTLYTGSWFRLERVG